MYRKMQSLISNKQEEVIFYSGECENIADIKTSNIEEINEELAAANRRAILLWDDVLSLRGLLHVHYSDVLENVSEKEFNVYSTILSNSDKNPAIPFVVKSNFIIMNYYVYSVMEQAYNWY